MKKRLLSFAAGMLCICCMSSFLAEPAVAKKANAQLLTTQAALVTKPGTVTGLKAAPAGKNRVKLTWSAVSGAEGYLVYGQKSGKYAYVGMTSSGSTTTFTDTKALDGDYNYYWVFAYVKDSAGKMIAGACQKYVYAKGICPAVTNLKASSTNSGVKLTWSKVATADGYLIYGKTDSTSYGYKAMTTNTSWTDTNAPTYEYSYYWVFPYHKDANGKMVSGGTASYVYGKKTVPVYTSYKVGDLSFKVLTQWGMEEGYFKGYKSYFFYDEFAYLSTSCQNITTASNAANVKFDSLLDQYVKLFESNGTITVKTRTTGTKGDLRYCDLEIAIADCEFYVYGRVFFDTKTGNFYEFMSYIYPEDVPASDITTYKKRVNAVTASVTK